MKFLRYENGFLNLSKFDDFFIIEDIREEVIFLRLFCYKGDIEAQKLLIDKFPYNEKDKEQVINTVKNLKKFLMDSINDFLENDDVVFSFLSAINGFNSMEPKAQP